MSQRAAHLLVLIVLTLAVAGCDQLTKDLARSALVPYAPTSYAGGLVELHLVENRGGFLSLGDRMPEPLRLAIFRWLVPGLLIVLAFGAWSGSSRAQTLGLAMILGGGLGNWVDRLSEQAAVTDFVRIALGPVQTGIFNLADVALVAGLVLLAFPWRAEETDPPDATEVPSP